MVFIRHRRSENSPFTTQNFPTKVRKLMTIFYSDVELFSKYSPVTLYLTSTTRFLNKPWIKKINDPALFWYSGTSFMRPPMVHKILVVIMRGSH